MPISPGFIVISKIKPVKDESTGGAAPIRSVLQPEITRIPGAEKREIQRRWSADMQSTHFESPVSLLRIKFCYFIYLLLYSFLPQHTIPAFSHSRLISDQRLLRSIGLPVLVIKMLPALMPCFFAYLRSFTVSFDGSITIRCFPYSLHSLLLLPAQGIFYPP